MPTRTKNGGRKDGDKLYPSCNSFYQWGNKWMSRTFMLDYGAMLDPDHWIGFAGPKQVFLRCGDAECNNSESPLNFRTCGKEYSFPAGKPGSGRAKLRGEAVFRELLMRSAVIELTDEDVIMGADPKISGLLNWIVSRYGVPVNVLYTCINKLIGGDMASLVKQANENKGGRVVYMECSNQDDPVEQFVQLLRSLKIKGNIKTLAGTVNLVGYADEPSVLELKEILRDLFGIKVNISFLPGLDVNKMKDFGRAKLQVLNRIEMYNSLFHAVFKGRKMRILKPPAPYGMRQSISWLKAVAGFFDIRLDDNKRWEGFIRPRLLQWDDLVRQAAGHRLGFIVSRDDIGLLTDAAKFPYAVPLLSCLEEMGFSLNILITSENSFDDCKRSVLKELREKERHRIDMLKDGEDVERWISKAPCSCIYSDFRNDRRLIANGKIPFSAFMFEKGPDGAIRTLQSLLRLCRIDLFRSYRGYARQAVPLPPE